MEKVRRVFRSPVVLEQLTYAGVFETVTIQQSGWPFRSPHERFAKRYFVLDLKNAAALRRLGPSGHARALLAGLRASDDRCFGEAQASLERGDAVLKALEEGERLAGILEALVAKDDAAAHYDDLERALKAVDAVADPDATRGGRLSAAAEAARAQERAAEAWDAVFAEVAAVVPPIRNAAGAGACAVPLDRRAVDAARAVRGRGAVGARRRDGGGERAGSPSATPSRTRARASWSAAATGPWAPSTRSSARSRPAAAATTPPGSASSALRCAAEDDAAADEIARALAAGAVAASTRSAASTRALAPPPRTRPSSRPGLAVGAACAALEAAARTIADLRGALARAPPDLAGAAAALDVLRTTSVDETAAEAVSAFRAPIRRSPAAPAKQASWLDAAEAGSALAPRLGRRGPEAGAGRGDGRGRRAPLGRGRRPDGGPGAARRGARGARRRREAPSLATVGSRRRRGARGRAALAKGDYDALEDAGLHFDAVVVAREAGVHGDGGGDGVVDMAVLGAEMDCLRVEVLNVRAREACEAVAATPRVVGVPGAVDGSRLDPVASAALAVAGKVSAAHADDWDAILTKGVLDVDSAEVALLRDEASDRRDRAAALAALAEGRPRGAVGSLDVGAVDDAPLRALDGGRRSPATAGDVDLDEAALRQAAAACDVLAESERVKIHADRLRVGPRLRRAVASDECALLRRCAALRRVARELAAAVVAGPALGAPGALDLATCTTGAIAGARYAGLDASCGALDAAVRVAAALADLRTRAKEDVPWDLEATVARVAAVAEAVAAFGRASDATGGADWSGAFPPGALAPVVEEAHLVEVEAHDRIIARDVPRLAAAGRVAGAPGNVDLADCDAEGLRPALDHARRWAATCATPSARRCLATAEALFDARARRSPAAGPTSLRPSAAGAARSTTPSSSRCASTRPTTGPSSRRRAPPWARPASGDAGALVAGDPRRFERRGARGGARRPQERPGAALPPGDGRPPRRAHSAPGAGVGRAGARR
ncbi:hypothetical protein JL721_10289 [Aureococcus anophagefferens]|nr:hypothetical protein JL721_10289 [Aureococcus anophagefferens]